MTKVSGKIFDIKLFKKLFLFIKPFKLTYYFVSITAILLSVFSTLTPYLLKITVDDFIRPKNYSGMLFLICLMLFTLIRDGSGNFQIYDGHDMNTACGFALEYRNQPLETQR